MTNSRCPSSTLRQLLEESTSEIAMEDSTDDSRIRRQDKPHRPLRWAWSGCLVFGVIVSALCALDLAAKLYATNARVSTYINGHLIGGRELVTICRSNTRRDVSSALSEENSETVAARTGIVRVGAVSFTLPTTTYTGEVEGDVDESSECHQQLANPNHHSVWGWISSFVSSHFDVTATTTVESVETDETTTSTPVEIETKKAAPQKPKHKAGLKLPKVVTQWGQKDEDGIVTLTPEEDFKHGGAVFCGEGGGKTSAKQLMNMIHSECLGENEKGELQTMPCSSSSVLSFCVDRTSLQLRTMGGKCMGIRRVDLTVGEAPVMVHECGYENHVNEWQFAGWFGWHVYNVESRMCWDVLHQHKNGTIIQWRCKMVTDYKPPNQWFVWVE
eukprot:comp21138_c0_seq1/m.28592 comp21138_c0_seq1/g.28592  ORF comp21138_c0_seq1/g.28592 comp21138_c0_seq1/m.28592 type:complete len:387 (-) comp21138_c0_seq1:445-1605(-)